ncbi:hypothetical protein BOX15_Mlig023028g4 [Macrostomum lignano]|uniref:Uncharacterized protein n=2 Tax=Macrostomum lignano TaxID=282301 RepID=A0A267E9V4_9PLAT|nr:hypothetical protein BOX15_Mlig023028g4 [Macrostomum lignano]
MRSSVSETTHLPFNLLRCVLLLLALACPNHLTSSKRCPPMYDSVQQTSCGCSKADFDMQPASTGPARLWPGGIVFYDFDNRLDTYYRKLIVKCVKLIESLVGTSHLEFRPMLNEKKERCSRDSFLLFKRGDSKAANCKGPVGMAQTGITTIVLDQQICSYEQAILMPIISVLGLQDEDNRSDRDEHIQVRFDEVYQPTCAAFKARTTPDATEKLPYDYKSITHKYSCMLSCRGEYTLLDLEGKPVLDSYMNFTDLDVAKLRALYPESTKTPFSMEMCDARYSRSRKSDPSSPRVGVRFSEDNSSDSHEAWTMATQLSVTMATLCAVYLLI